MCDHGRYIAKKVLYISFLHCKHKARISQERALWGVINPQLHDNLTHEEAEEFFNDLSHIAIELPLAHCRYLVKDNLEQQRQDKDFDFPEEEQKQLEAVIAYLETSSAERLNKVKELTNALGESIDKTQLFTLAVSDHKLLA